MSPPNDLVCQHRHPLEWAARIPRTRACDDCTQLVELVLNLTRKELA